MHKFPKTSILGNNFYTEMSRYLISRNRTKASLSIYTNYNMISAIHFVEQYFDIKCT